MKRQTIAQPTIEWDGFRFVRYWLDEKKILDLPVIEQRAMNGNVDHIPTTVGSIYKSLAERGTDSQNPSLSGPSFNCQILLVMLNLKNEGIDPFGAEWFWYDFDRGIQEPHDVYRFFVACNDKIVRDCVEFSDYTQSGFDPSIFYTIDDRERFSSNQVGLTEAGIRFWYRKFYMETRMGQLMILRRDHPKLFDYESPPKAPDSTSLLENALSLLKKIHTLMWILIILACLMLIRGLR